MSAMVIWQEPESTQTFFHASFSSSNGLNKTQCKAGYGTQWESSLNEKLDING